MCIPSLTDAASRRVPFSGVTAGEAKRVISSAKVVIVRHLPSVLGNSRAGVAIPARESQIR
jgi:hypothetical protein